MMKKGYTGIDYFRIAAAFLIITIHTSPLAFFWRDGDFFLTRVIARVGVPFFFMTTGFFLLPRLEMKERRSTQLRHFIKKTGLIYLASILFYLPINSYTGYFSEDFTLLKLLKDIFFDGTFYHLWYLPAVIIGVCIVTWMLVRLRFAGTAAVCGLLYAAGLLGDSYYGLAERIPFGEQVYQFIFSFSDYTRNGIFFAPVFLLLGYAVSRGRKPGKKTIVAGTVLSLFMMSAEAFALRYFSFMRHDSMYVFLIPTMYFLFSGLICFRGKRNESISHLALGIYLTHPFFILVVRAAGKVTGLTGLLVENSLMHYIMTSVLTFCAVYLVLCCQGRRRKTVNAKGRAWTEINLTRLAHNVKELSRLLPSSCRLMAVVKADAYGHGDIVISKYLNRLGVDSFAVATLQEGVRLRKSGVRGDILILGYTHPDDFSWLIRYHLIQTVIDEQYAFLLNQYGKKVMVHIKVDTGMHRLGEEYSHFANIAKIYSYPNLNVKGIYSHLCAADSGCEENRLFTLSQIDSFSELLTKLYGAGFELGNVHIQNSYGLLNYPECQMDYARVGILLYGVQSSGKEDLQRRPELEPVLSIRARIASIRNIENGDSVGYGRLYQADTKRRIAVVTIGYGDGIPGELSKGGGRVLIHGQYALIIGKICMDQMMVDITGLSGVRVGDAVTVIGEDEGKRIKAEEVALRCGMITNELLSRLGKRLKRVYEQEAG